LFVWLSDTQTTPPIAAQVTASGVSLPGTTTSYTFAGLDSDKTYYGWAVATRQGYVSDVMANTPVFLKTDPAYPALNSCSIAPGTNPDQDIPVTISATDVDTLFIWLSETQSTQPTVAQMIASGVALPCTTTNYTFTGLDQATYYYGWVVGVQGSYESVCPAPRHKSQ
jgi:hypothetical protein